MRPVSEAWKDAPFPPRDWQAEALPIVLERVLQFLAPIVWVVMGGGKSVFAAEMCWLAEGVVVVLTPSQDLVNQLHKTIAGRCDDVGRFFANQKDTGSRVIVCCYDSLPSLVKKLAALGIKVELLIVDEAHGSEAEVVRNAIVDLDAKYRVGLTATPWRSEAKEKLSIWNEICYEYNLSDAILDDVLVPFQVVHAETEGDLDDVCIDMLRQYKGHNIIVNATTIADGEEFKDRLIAEDFMVAFVHSKLSMKKRDLLLDSFRSGHHDVLLHVSSCAEGFDAPIADVLCMRRKVGASVRFSQEVGRVLRASAGKELAYLLDPNDLFSTMRIAIAPQVGEYTEEEEEEEEGPESPLAFLDARYRAEMKKARGEAKNPAPLKKHRSKVLGRYKPYLRQLAISIQGAGFHMYEVRRGEKTFDAKPEQVRWIKENSNRLKGLEMPEAARAALRQVYSVVEWMTRQEAADFRSCVVYLSAKGWSEAMNKMVILPPPLEIDQVMLEYGRLQREHGNVKRFLKSLPDGVRARLEKSQGVSEVRDELP